MFSLVSLVTGILMTPTSNPLFSKALFSSATFIPFVTIWSVDKHFGLVNTTELGEGGGTARVLSRDELVCHYGMQ